MMVYKNAIVPKDVVELHKFCDVCGTEINIGLACSKANCLYCKRDLCEDCIGHEDGTSGDYRDVYCKDCWNKGNVYIPKIELLHKNIDGLYKEWQDKCKSTTTTQ